MRTMPSDARAYFPARETLAAFLRMNPRGRVRVPVLAPLLGASDNQVREVLRSEGMELRLDSVPWHEATAYVFDAWPLAQIIAALGDAAQLIPAGFHPSPVCWEIPVFIVHALKYQATLMRGDDPRVNGGGLGHFTSPSIDDYVADVLFNEIQPATIAALSHDATFVQAYNYPYASAVFRREELCAMA